MPKPQGTIGETKFKILSIVYRNDVDGNGSYGYGIWAIMKKRFYCYLEEAGLIEKSTTQTRENSPERQLYLLTESGRQLKARFNKYLQKLEVAK